MASDGPLYSTVLCLLLLSPQVGSYFVTAKYALFSLYVTIIDDQVQPLIGHFRSGHHLASGSFSVCWSLPTCVSPREALFPALY